MAFTIYKFDPNTSANDVLAYTANFQTDAQTLASNLGLTNYRIYDNFGMLVYSTPVVTSQVDIAGTLTTSDVLELDTSPVDGNV